MGFFTKDTKEDALKQLEKINQEIPEEEAKYKNPRNLCSGSVRQLNNEMTAKRNVQFYAFALVKAEGIDFENYEYVVEIIKEQEDAMKKGLFTENEIEQAKAMLINQLMEAYDTPSGIIDILMQSVDSGLSNNLYDQIQKIKNVSKNDIIHAANKWALDTIYFLNRKKEAYNENYGLQKTRGNCLL